MHFLAVDILNRRHPRIFQSPLWQFNFLRIIHTLIKNTLILILNSSNRIKPAAIFHRIITLNWFLSRSTSFIKILFFLWLFFAILRLRLHIKISCLSHTSLLQYWLQNLSLINRILPHLRKFLRLFWGILKRILLRALKFINHASARLN